MPSFKIREPKFAGKLYPADKLNLEREIALYLETANVEGEPKDIKGLILPFGDYRITGGVISRAVVNVLNRKIKRVIMLAPTYQPSRAGVEVYSGDGYQTPLGIITVDKKLCKKIAGGNDSFCHFDEIWHLDSESGIETSLPFLQSTLGNFNLIPILVGEMIEKDIENFVKYLANIVSSDDTLIVLNLNLSIGKPYEQALALDNELMRYIRTFSIKELYKKSDDGSILLSKIDSLSIFMNTLQTLEKNNLEVLTYRNSGDITGNKSSTDGYFSAIVH